jgi:acyl-CoA thioester hydrolase
MKHKTKIQIRFKDLDSLGHVNNANYFSYFELARVEYFKTVMGVKTIDWNVEGLILAKVEMNFKVPVLLDDEILIYTWTSRFGSKSFDMNCSFVKLENGKEIEIASGMTVLVCMNYQTKASIEMPALWKQKIQEFESKC